LGKGSGADEGSVFAVGSLIILLCIGGSQQTHTSPIQFFFMGITFLMFSGLFFAIVLGVCISIIRVWVEAHKADGRSLWQIIKQEYSAKKLREIYTIMFGHVHKHLSSWWHSDAAGPFRRGIEKITGRVRNVTYTVREAWRAYLDADIDHIGKDDYK
jgi:hypothetical protein